MDRRSLVPGDLLLAADNAVAAVARLLEAARPGECVPVCKDLVTVVRR